MRRSHDTWMMYMRPYLSHWMNLELSMGWGKYTWLLGLFVQGFGTFLNASVGRDGRVSMVTDIYQYIRIALEV